MEKLRKVVREIAYTQEQAKLSTVNRSLLPLLTVASFLYRFTLSLRRFLYDFGLLSKQRLPVPVISVGNLTWGGNGKTPMVEFIAQWLADSEISPLILTRGYAGGDEARMLTRHLLGTSAKIGIGANRAATAVCFLKQYGCTDPKSFLFEGMCVDQKVRSSLNFGKIGAIILDDGMQHWSLHRDLEVVMVNGLSPWGNNQLIPLGPLREPLAALRRADVAVVHHANLVSEQSLKDIELMMKEVKESLPIFFTRMSPSHFFEVGNINFRIPLDVIQEAIVLCVSAIGSADSFVQGIEKDIEMIMMKLSDLEGKFGFKPLVIVTEKDYDRDPAILSHLSPFKVMALHSELQIIPHRQLSKDVFTKLLTELLEVKWSGAKRN